VVRKNKGVSMKVRVSALICGAVLFAIATPCFAEPTLDETLKFIKANIEEQPAFMVNELMHSYTFSANGCDVKNIDTYTYKGNSPKVTKYEFALQDLEGANVIGANYLNVGARNDVIAVTRDGMGIQNESYHLIHTIDKFLTERIVNAFNHAIALCKDVPKTKSAEPF
jgi:hypothetical protein